MLLPPTTWVPVFRRWALSRPLGVIGGELGSPGEVGGLRALIFGRLTLGPQLLV